MWERHVRGQGPAWGARNLVEFLGDRFGTHKEVRTFAESFWDLIG